MSTGIFLEKELYVEDIELTTPSSSGISENVFTFTLQEICVFSWSFDIRLENTPRVPTTFALPFPLIYSTFFSGKSYSVDYQSFYHGHLYRSLLAFFFLFKNIDIMVSSYIKNIKRKRISS